MSSDVKEKLRKPGEQYELPPETMKKLENLGERLKKEQIEELEHIKSILTPEEFLEFQKEREMRKSLQVKLIGEYDKGEKEILEKITREKVERFLAEHADKRFHVSQTFYNYAMERLFETFRWSQEYPIVGVFRKENNQMVMQRFFDSDWLIKNGYAKPHLGMSFIIGEPKDGNYKGSFKAVINWSSTKVSELEKEADQSDEYLICFHTHSFDACPSAGDKIISYVMGIAGFEHPNQESKQLAMNSFLTKIGFKNNPRYKEVMKTAEELIRGIESMNLPSYRKKIEIDRIRRYHPNGEVHYVLQPYDVDSDLWSRLYNECHPTIGLFANLAKQEPKRVPLYLNGKLL
jgi:hypothetical protein